MQTFPDPAPPRLLRYARQSHVTLNRNAPHVYAARHSLSIYAPRVVYSFIPKNACSTLRYSVALANGVIAGPQDAGWIHKNNHSFAATLNELVTAQYTFAVLRCPYTRLASAYLDKVLDRQLSLARLRNVGLAGKSKPEVFLRKALRRTFIDGFRKADFSHLSFRDFVARLDRPGAPMIDPHFAPQTAFLVYEEYDGLFQMEKFGTAVKTIHAESGFQISDARDIIKHGTDQHEKVEGGFADTTIADLVALKNEGKVPTHASLYDDALRERVRAIYADDFALYTAQFGDGDLLFS